jgi:lipoprotein signal peptidase
MNLVPAIAPAIRRWRPTLETLIIAPRERFASGFGIVALMVLAGDALTKELAIRILPSGGASIGLLDDTIRFVPLHNDQAALGLSLGAYTWHVGVVLLVATILLVVRVCRELGAVDPWAPRILGLIAGAACGNLFSLILSPAGVPDFIALDVGGGREVVMNLADIAAYVGLVLLGRTAWMIVQRLRARAA